MERLEEIAKRQAEIKELLEDESKEVDLDSLNSELSELDAEETKIQEETKTAEVEAQKAEAEAEEKRNLEKKTLLEEIKNNQVELKQIDKKSKEEKKVEERKFGLDSPEYRNGWAKKLMGLSEDKFTENELRAIGDAVTTTATQFVQATSGANGINNGGLFIPESVITGVWEEIDKMSPFLRDVRKLSVAGNISLPYGDSADDAEWYAETADTKQEGIEFKEITLTGHELAKNIVVKWKLEAMAVKDFISFLQREMARKMGKALAVAVLYGNGSLKPTGAVNGLTPVTGTDPVETIVNTFKELDADFRIGAKAYLSSDVNIDIVGYKDGNDNYPFLQGLATTKLVELEVEPFLNSGDLIVGNPINYVLNTTEQMSVARESHVAGRKTTYGAYTIVDGKPVPNAFALGHYTVDVS